MTIERDSVVDRIEITREGTVGVRMALRLMEDGNVLHSSWHRTSIPPGTDPAAQMAEVNSHLQSMGEGLISAEDIAKVVLHCTAGGLE